MFNIAGISGTSNDAGHEEQQPFIYKIVTRILSDYRWFQLSSGH